MARRRMIDPGFWTDPRTKKLTRDERLLFIGMFNNADDEGRLQGDPRFLKSIIFPYDEDITAANVRQMRDRIAEVNPNVVIYQNSEEDYIQFIRWGRYQKPRYPKPSILPSPPTPAKSPTPTDQTGQGELFTQKDESLQPESDKDVSFFPPQSRSGQVRSGQVRLGQVSQARLSPKRSKGEGTGFVNLPDDLTDFDWDDFEETRRARPAAAAEAAWAWYERNVGAPEKPERFLEQAMKTMREHSGSDILRALSKVKAAGGGKHKSWSYVEKTITELETKARDSPDS